MAMGDAMQALGVLHFRGKQGQAIQAVLSGADVYCVFPSGCGKSLVYPVAALCSEGVTVIVSPLVGLPNEQVEKMANVGLRVIAACGGTLDSFNRTDGVKMVYTTPEQLQQKSKLCKYVKEKHLQVAAVVVGEAHVIRDWEEFR
jgi:ATP-dependent DNA helicase RecQ